MFKFHILRWTLLYIWSCMFFSVILWCINWVTTWRNEEWIWWWWRCVLWFRRECGVCESPGCCWCWHRAGGCEGTNSTFCCHITKETRNHEGLWFLYFFSTKLTVIWFSAWIAHYWVWLVALAHAFIWAQATYKHCRVSLGTNSQEYWLWYIRVGH